MRRRCWPTLARTRALILDEPLAVDAASQRGLLRLLEDLRRARGLTVVEVSHDLAGMEELPAYPASARRCVGIGGGVGGGGMSRPQLGPGTVGLVARHVRLCC